MDWIPVCKKLPPEKVPVMTKIDDEKGATILMVQDGKPLYRESFFLSEVGI